MGYNSVCDRNSGDRDIFSLVAGTSGYKGESKNRRPDSAAAFGNPGDVRPVGEGVSELRIPHGPGYRVYYVQRGNIVIILLCGGDKGTQDKDIRMARKLAKETA